MSGVRHRPMALTLTAVATAVAGLALPGAATAATQIGATFAPAIGENDGTFLQSASPGSQYAAPSDGVITSWIHQATAMAQQLKLKVARSTGVNDFTVVGSSALETINPSTLNTFSTRIPAQPGDVIGVYTVTVAPFAIAVPGYGLHSLPGDVPPGTTATFTPNSGFQFDVAATLEPDCDGDGFGDETQDSNILTCFPQTTLAKGPKDRTTKKKATFEFSSDVASATFECSLDGGTFQPCTSPHEVQVKKGKHSFEVRATARGFTDQSPATDDWKVKKKKK